jgi:formylglycine-generating enzyme
MKPSFLIFFAALFALPDVMPQATNASSGVSFEWATVGDADNPNDPLIGLPDPSHQRPPRRGSVSHVYSISKYETTIGQYTAFLNAVAKSDPHGLYHADLGQQDSIRGISRAGTEGNYVYYVKNLHSFLGGGISAYLPVTYVGYFEAARFVNWLHNGQGNGSTETGAYTISKGEITRASRSGGVVTLTTAQPHTLSSGDRVMVSASDLSGTFVVSAITDTTFSYLLGGADFAEQDRTGSMTGISATHNSDARYWIPTENEWYKAAYYDLSPQGPADDYWLYPWRSDVLEGRPANFYNGTYTVSGRPNPPLGYTFLTDVRVFSEVPSYYGTVNQAGNVEEWTEGDTFSGGPRPRGGHWQGPAEEAPARMSSYSDTFLAPNGRGPLVGFRVATVANPPSGGLRNGDKIRYYPRAGYNNRMVGGVFEGDGTVLHTVTEVPPTDWTEVNVDFASARYFRYRSPNDGNGNVAEIEFSRSGARVIAAASGTPGSWSGKDDDTFYAALDGNTSTFFDAPQPNGAYVELDAGIGSSSLIQGISFLNVDSFIRGAQAGQRLGVNARPTPPGHYFAGWTGFRDILGDPSSPNTTATFPGNGVDMWLTSTFKPLPPGTAFLQVVSGSGDGIYPTGRIVTVSADPPSTGQVFAGWQGDIAILSNPFHAVTTAIIPFMNVTIVATFRETGSGDKIRFYPRTGYSNRMVGGVFEGTTGDPITGPYTTIYTVSSDPPLGWSEISVSLSDHRYLRYRGPNDSHANVAEIEFYRNGAKLSGTGFGTPGSWNDSGNTFERALDADTNTFFDAPTGNGAYVGIDTQ